MKTFLIGLTALLTFGSAGLDASVAFAQGRAPHETRGAGGFGRAGGERGGYPGDFRGGAFRGGDFRAGGFGGGYPMGEFRGGGYGPPAAFARGGYGPRGLAGPRGRAYPPPGGFGGAPRALTRGQFLPPGYGAGGVIDPRQYHLRRPPNGYGWVTVGHNAYLTQRSTGLILDTAPLY